MIWYVQHLIGNTYAIVTCLSLDQDGTLTVPVIDFNEMRSRIGVPNATVDTLDFIKSQSPEDQIKSQNILKEIEERALKDMKVMPGLLELAEMLDGSKIPRALLTRNVADSVDHFHRHHFNSLPPFFPALSREFTPYKPDPSALIHIADHWSIQPHELCIVGDSARDDIACGNRAGALTILLDTESKYKRLQELPTEQQPHYYATSLHEVAVFLRTHCRLKG